MVISLTLLATVGLMQLRAPFAFFLARRIATYVQVGVHHDLQVLFCRASLRVGGCRHTWVYVLGVVPESWAHDHSRMSYRVAAGKGLENLLFQAFETHNLLKPTNQQ